MQERKIKILSFPDDLVILRQKKERSKGEPHYAEIKLENIPDDEFDFLADAVAGMKKEQALGNDSAGVPFTFQFGKERVGCFIVVRDSENHHNMAPHSLL